MRSALSALLLACALFSAGCEEYMWWEVGDDPYLAAMGEGGSQEMLGNINSVYSDRRQVALRLAAHRAARARQAGDVASAERLEGIIVRRYQIEREPEVRLCIIRICAPACGPGSTAMVRFLRERIAAGDFPGHAALALAELRYRTAFDDILPLTRHPAPEVRYQAATALAVLGDPRGYEAVTRIIYSMTPPAWPEWIEGVELDEARNSLTRKAERAFGRY